MKIFLSLILSLFCLNAFGAFSATKTERFVCGSMNCELWSLNFASVTEGGFSTGLAKVKGAFLQNQTTEGQCVVYPNSTTASAIEDDGGKVFVAGCTSNDIGTILIMGR